MWNNCIRQWKIQVSQKIPSRELTISHLGKRKIIFKHAMFWGYVSSLEGIFLQRWSAKHPIENPHHPPPRTRRTSSRDPNRSLELGRSRELGRSVTARVVARGIRALLLASAPFFAFVCQKSGNLPSQTNRSHVVQVTWFRFFRSKSSEAWTVGTNGERNGWEKPSTWASCFTRFHRCFHRCF